MRFAIFGNTYQAHKSFHAENLFRLLKQHNAQFTIQRDFHQFLTEELHLSLPTAELFDGNDFDADMAISIGGDGTFLKAASRVGKRIFPFWALTPDAWVFWPISRPKRWKRLSTRFTTTTTR